MSFLSRDTTAALRDIAPLVEEHADEIADTLYNLIFEETPAARSYFSIEFFRPRANDRGQPKICPMASGSTTCPVSSAASTSSDEKPLSNCDISSQAHRLAASVLHFCMNIDKIGLSTREVQRVAAIHVSRGVLPAHYPLIGVALLDAIRKALQEAASDEVMNSFGEAYETLMQVFIEEEASIRLRLSETPGGWNNFRKFIVTEVSEQRNGACEVTVEPIDKQLLMGYQPGQAVCVRWVDKAHGPLVKNVLLAASPIRPSQRRKSYCFSIPKSQDHVGIFCSDLLLRKHVRMGCKVELSAPCGGYAFSERSEIQSDLAALSTNGPNLVQVTDRIQSKSGKIPTCPSVAARQSKSGYIPRITLPRDAIDERAEEHSHRTGTDFSRRPRPVAVTKTLPLEKKDTPSKHQSMTSKLLSVHGSGPGGSHERTSFSGRIPPTSVSGCIPPNTQISPRSHLDGAHVLRKGTTALKNKSLGGLSSFETASEDLRCLVARKASIIRRPDQDMEPNLDSRLNSSRRGSFSTRSTSKSIRLAPFMGEQEILVVAPSLSEEESLRLKDQFHDQLSHGPTCFSPASSYHRNAGTPEVIDGDRPSALRRKSSQVSMESPLSQAKTSAFRIASPDNIKLGNAVGGNNLPLRKALSSNQSPLLQTRVGVGGKPVQNRKETDTALDSLPATSLIVKSLASAAENVTPRSSVSNVTPTSECDFELPFRKTNNIESFVNEANQGVPDRNTVSIDSFIADSADDPKHCPRGDNEPPTTPETENLDSEHDMSAPKRMSSKFNFSLAQNSPVPPLRQDKAISDGVELKRAASNLSRLVPVEQGASRRTALIIRPLKEAVPCADSDSDDEQPVPTKRISTFNPTLGLESPRPGLRRPAVFHQPTPLLKESLKTSLDGGSSAEGPSRILSSRIHGGPRRRFFEQGAANSFSSDSEFSGYSLSGELSDSAPLPTVE